jgi:hypothetical protein
LSEVYKFVSLERGAHHLILIIDKSGDKMKKVWLCLVVLVSMLSAASAPADGYGR